MTEENGLVLRRYWTNVCQSCAIKATCTSGKERRITRWEHEHVLEAVQRRLDEHPEKMRQRRKTVEHPFGTIKARMGATHFLMKTLPRVATEMAPRLQSHPRHEHHRRPTAHGGEGIVCRQSTAVRCWPESSSETLPNPISRQPRRK